MANVVSRLEPLKTLHETRTNDQFVEAFVVEIPAKLANKALGIVRPIFPNDRQLSLHHLRRVVSLSHLPLDLTWRRDYDSNGLQTVFLLLPNTTSVPWQTICATLAPHIDVAGLPRCFNAVVPQYAPLTAEQAAVWSERYWPTIFNPASQVLQDAPPVNQLKRVQTELDTDLTVRFMDIAWAAAKQALNSGNGQAVGAVVVNPVTQQIVAVAGDARWWSQENMIREDDNTNHKQRGRPEYHALMRVIAMVANRELHRRLKSGGHTRFVTTCSETPAGQTLTEIEKFHAEAVVTSPSAAPNDPFENFSSSLSSSLSSTQSTSRSDGYLCSGLDLYLSHEPCVCCAMAMVHSRFRACVFEKKMPGSGSLCARDEKNGLAYGLFWRRELNWRVMTFKYQPSSNRDNKLPKAEEIFHA